MADRPGADVTILDVDLERLRYLDLAMDKRKHALFERGELARADARLRFADWRSAFAGAKAPKLITRADAAKMKPGSVLVDISIDQGGCAGNIATHYAP